ncbi:MAG: hypothetical protein LBU65_02115 [Planctomycetaceae bacterium]|nr:hypothetical protein [Planctomycetaceae bacterium]
MLEVITGGVNYFAANPINQTLEDLDEMLLPFEAKNNRDWKNCDVDFIVNVLSLIGSEKVVGAWNPQTDFVDAIKNVVTKENIKTAKLFVSTGTENYQRKRYNAFGTRPKGNR